MKKLQDYPDKIITIIIPCYYESKYLDSALSSLAQQTIIDKINCILINDNSPNTNCNYQDIISKYSFNILIYNNNQSIGPGLSRQRGLNLVKTPYVMFLDDDDIFYDKFTLEKFYNIIIKNKNIGIIKGGLSLNNEEYYFPKQNNTLQGCLLNYSIIKTYNITFHPIVSWYEEDTYFLHQYLYTVKMLNLSIYYLDTYNISYVRQNNSFSLSKNTLDFNKMLNLLIVKISNLHILKLYHFEDVYRAESIQATIFMIATLAYIQLYDIQLDSKQHLLLLQYYQQLKSNEYYLQGLQKIQSDTNFTLDYLSFFNYFNNINIEVMHETIRNTI